MSKLESANMIGMFDSGSGGLTVLRAIRRKMPNVGVIYFGDIANAPYGGKSQRELAELTRRGIELLISKGATALVSACNSVSASVLASEAEGMPFIEMSLPMAGYLKKYEGKRFLLMATPATIASGLYTKALQGNISLDSLPIFELAGAIEFGHSEDEIKEILNRAFVLRKGESYDGLILGCTHYPLVRELIEEVSIKYFGNLHIIDPAYPVAEAVEDTLNPSDGSLTFLISQPSDAFEKRVKEMFPKSSNIQML